MNGYELSRNFVDFSFENPSKIKPNHYALYFFSVEHCNRLGWKKEFGLPTTMTMEAIGIKSYASYIKTFNELIDLGFFILIERSKNQYSSNIIELSENVKALDKALDKAFVKHASKQQESTHESSDSINKPVTSKPLTNNNRQIAGVVYDLSNVKDHKDYYNELVKDMANEHTWLESLYRNDKVIKGKLGNLVDLFIIHLMSKDIKDRPENLSDFKQHCASWIRLKFRMGSLLEYSSVKPKGSI